MQWWRWFVECLRRFQIKFNIIATWSSSNNSFEPPWTSLSLMTQMILIIAGNSSNLQFACSDMTSSTSFDPEHATQHNTTQQVCQPLKHETTRKVSTKNENRREKGQIEESERNLPVNSLLPASSPSSRCRLPHVLATCLPPHHATHSASMFHVLSCCCFHSSLLFASLSAVPVCRRRGRRRRRMGNGEWKVCGSEAQYITHKKIGEQFSFTSQFSRSLRCNQKWERNSLFAWARKHKEKKKVHIKPNKKKGFEPTEQSSGTLQEEDRHKPEKFSMLNQFVWRATHYQLWKREHFEYFISSSFPHPCRDFHTGGSEILKKKREEKLVRTALSLLLWMCREFVRLCKWYI